jgi:cytochrome c556
MLGMKPKGEAMTRTAIVASLLAVGLVAALAQSDPIAARKELMTLNGKAFYGDLNRMVRGQAPYDQAKVDAAFNQLVTSAKTFTTLYPDNAKPGAKTSASPEDKYSASPKVWENKADFEAKNADLVKVVTSVRGNVKNLDSLKSAFADVSKACDACHETYRLRAN